MPKMTAYKTMITEYRNCREKVMAGGKKCYFEFATDVLTFRGWCDLAPREKKLVQIILFS
jgi:hypothetical protein